MGYDAACMLTIDGKSSRGTALLETKELIVRGPTRLVIPLASISKAVARDGTLTLVFGDKTAELGIGAAAEKWAKRILNPPSRLDKLGVKPGMSVAAIGLDDEVFLTEVEMRAGGIRRSVPRTCVDMIFYAANNRQALSKLEALAKLLQPAGALWVIRPKGRPEITEAETMAAGKRAGLVDVKVVSFSETHTAEKYVIPVARRKSLG